MFGDMAIYTTCKNNTFNGMPLPDIWLRHGDKTMERLTDFGYEDFSAVEAEDSQACDNCGSCEEACDGCESACDGCAETEDSAVTVEDSAEATEEHGADEKEANDDNIENIKTSDR